MNQFIGSTFIQTGNGDRLSAANRLIGITTIDEITALSPFSNPVRWRFQ